MSRWGSPAERSRLRKPTRTQVADSRHWLGIYCTGGVARFLRPMLGTTRRLLLPVQLGLAALDRAEPHRRHHAPLRRTAMRAKTHPTATCLGARQVAVGDRDQGRKDP